MKLLIIDDHPVFRQGLAALVEQSFPGATVLQEPDAPAATRAIEAHHDIDIAVLDLVIPGMNGLDLLADLGRRWPQLPVLVVTGSENPADLRAAMARGASGYVPKSAAASTLASALRLVMAGELYVPPLALQSTQTAPAQPLTERQMEVLRLLAEGAANKAIAQSLALSEKTVKAHLVTIFKALGASSRTQAIAAARRLGLL